MKHTPGPWHVEPTLRQLIVSDRGTIAEPWMHDTIGALESSANARLIAAAPDLLALLMQIASGSVMSGNFTHAETVETYQRFARAAIEKATGGKHEA